MFAPGTTGAVQAGVVVMTAVLTLSGFNYLYQLMSARWLGAADFGVVATLGSILMIVALPFGAVQLFVARDVAAEAAGGDVDPLEADALSTVVLLATVGLAGLTIVLSPWISSLLQISSWIPVILTGLALATAIPLIPLIGVLQGKQHFFAYSAALVTGAGVRLAALACLLIVGFGLNGALGATVIGGGAAIVVAAINTKGWHISRAALTGPRTRRVLRKVLPMTLGLLAVTALANTDIVVVKGSLSPDAAGTFGAAGLVAKVALFVPAAIIPIVQSRVAIRHAQKRSSSDILLRATLATVAFGIVFTAFCWATATPLMTIAFGAEFASAADILPLYCVAMTLVSVATLRVNFFLTRGENGVGYIALACAVAQAVALIVWHATLVQVLVVDIIAAAALIAIDVTVTTRANAAHRHA